MQTFVKAINDAGEVVGYYQTVTATHGFVLDANRFVTIDAPGVSLTEVTGINNHGAKPRLRPSDLSYNGWPGWYYALLRMIAEMLLALEIRNGMYLPMKELR